MGDFYLYPLTERTTIADKQTKQVSFLDAKGAAASGCQFENSWLGSSEEPRSAQSVLRFSSSQPHFTGESRIEHTPQGSTIALPAGDAFDVKVQPTTVSRTRQSNTRWRTQVRYRVTNARSRAVSLELAQGGLSWGDTRIVEESRKSEPRDSSTAVWQVPVPANGETVVTVAFDSRY